jgi:hypothetical protein
MNSSREVKFLIAILLFIFLVLLLACKEPIEGCLDVDAINYNVAADDPCADCCNYPGLELQINYQYDSIAFSYDSIYSFSGFDAQFDKIVFYLSDFQLVNEAQSLEVIEMIDLEEINGGVIMVKDDFVLLSPGRSIRYDIGEIRGGGGTYNLLEFKVGLAAAVTLTDAEANPEDHPLSLGIDSLWSFPEGYIYNQVTLVPDTADMNSTRVIDVRGVSNLVQIQLPYELDVSRGMQISIPLRVDFREWFSGIDFVGFTDEAIVEKIVTNTPQAFSIDD